MHELEHVIGELEGDGGFLSCVTRWERLEPAEGSYAPLPDDLPPELTKALAKGGITRLYSHQREAYDHIAAGRHVVVVTPTASGKTLCYTLPVLRTLSTDPAARALLLFPTKALSQDQQSALNQSILSGSLPVKVATYDGDTPTSVRASARETGQIIISNPDMMHAGILPNHPKWIKFLRNLRYVVIDEVHTYRGVFGSHLTNLIRRLKRVARFYGAEPRFICTSATIGNPQGLAEQVLEERVALVEKNGAPRGAKHLILYNPPMVDRVQGIRRGVVNEAQKLALRFLTRRIKTIVFARSRVRTELIASYINKTLANVYTDNKRINVESYRGGYLPNERRSVERGLRDGSIHGVVSTNALELGIDIGGLDVSILAGFPGSIASSLQQSGRAGRTRAMSLSILVASSSPLDQYIVKHPEYFFGRSPESGFVDPNNDYILNDHLKCAVFELPFGTNADEFPVDCTPHLEVLEDEGVVRYAGNKWYWSDRSYPAEGISLRSATSDNVVIVDTTVGRNQVIGEMDRPSAKEMVFTNAVYIHRGDQFVVTHLDLPNRRCYVEATDVNYYTDALVKRDIKILTQDEVEMRGDAGLVVGDILVRSQVTKYKKIKFRSHENVGYGEVSLPQEEMHTRAVVMLFTPESASGAALASLDESEVGPTIARLGTLIKNVAPLFLLCEAGDIGVAERTRDPHFAVPALYVYDSYPGGTGLAENFRSRMEEIIAAALELVANCPCDAGCPSCVGPFDPQTDIGADPKSAILSFLQSWVPDLGPVGTPSA